MTIALYVLLGLVLDLGFAVAIGRALAGRPEPCRPSGQLRLQDNARVGRKFAAGAAS